MRPVIAHIQIENLLHNFHLVRSRAAGAKVMAVVKANAYGHGLEAIAPSLEQAGCSDFAVTDACEGKRLRQLLKSDAHITLLSGLFDQNDAQTAEKSRLTPVVTERKHINWLKQVHFQGKVWLKVDTGMQRLGCSDPAQLINHCKQQAIELAGIMSHLACADTPSHPLNRIQVDEFRQLHQTLVPHLPASLLNSAGLVSLSHAAHDTVRPGLALYGIEPIPHEPLGLKPVMHLSAQIMQINPVSHGSTLSYGASYTASHDMKVALVCIGYGDGLPRQLSNQGFACFQKEKLAIVGRICMDYCLLDCSNSSLQVGDFVSFWGNDISCNDVATQVNSIAYTLMTGIQARVQRIPMMPEVNIA
ncbi:MAG: alanine racemase [Mariprofundaceae bacterium]